MPDVGEMIECSGCGNGITCHHVQQQTKMHLMTQMYIGIVIVVTSYYSYINIGIVIVVTSNLFCSLCMSETTVHYFKFIVNRFLCIDQV